MARIDAGVSKWTGIAERAACCILASRQGPFKRRLGCNPGSRKDGPKPMNRILLPLLLVTGTVIHAGFTQSPQPPPPLISPEVRTDNRVIFRFRDPNAKEVSLAREGATPVPMQKDEQGVWSVTTDPLEPDFYGYSFVADGVRLIDPSNPLMKPNLLNPQSVVHVPGPASLPWEVSNTPHGNIHRHFYRSTVVGDDRDFYVYTPTGYDHEARQLYPVFY